MNINKYLKPGQSINVTADAGTGKTWIIISKILRLLLEGESPEKITAITFTKKASAEMRDRLNEKISNWAYKDEENLIKELKEIGINKDINNYLKSAKKLFTKLQLDNKDIRICTFDSFFTEILSQLYLENDIFNNFEINEKLNSKLFSQEVENKIFTNKYIEKNKNFQENLRFLINHVGSFDSIKKSVIGIVEKKNYYLEISNKKNFINRKFFDKYRKFLGYKKNFVNNIHSLFIENNFQNIFPKLDLEYIFYNKNDEQVIEEICSIFLLKIEQ
jgi:ATP-dependent helicase/nuclease subunit A